MNTSIQRPNTVDFEQFQFSDVTVNKYGGKSCKVKYQGQDLYLQLPRMRLPYGLSVYEEKDPNGNVLKSKYSLDFSLSGFEMNESGEPVNPRIYEFFKFLEGMQEMLHTAASKNSHEWLGIDGASIEVAKALCRDEIRYAKDKITKKPTNKYAPTFKARVGFYEGRFICNAFNQDREPISDLSDSCPGGSEAISIVKLNNITFAGGKCGYSWNVHQVKIFPPTRMPSYAFIEDEEDNNPVSVPESDDKMVDDNSTENNMMENTKEAELVEDSDDDDDDDDDELDDDDEEEEVRPPTPPPKKKVVKKKITKKSS